MTSVRSRDGTAIAYERVGEGPAVILVGGALTNRSITGSLADRLAPRLTAFAYDRRGRGESGDAGPYRVERELEDLDALIDTAGGSAFVFGHSSGAALAIEAAAQGLPIARLAVYEPPFIVDGARPPLPVDFSAQLNAMTSSRRRGDAVEYFLTTGVGLPGDVVAQMRNAPTWTAMEELAHTLAYDATIMADTTAGGPLPASWASTVTMPTLVMDGGRSEAWQRHATRALVELLPLAEHRTFEDADHGIAPEILAPVLIEFFSTW